MTLDAQLAESRVAAVRDLPWPMPALVILEMSDADLDRLDATAGTPRYWTVLNGIVRRIEEAP